MVKGWGWRSFGKVRDNTGMCDCGRSSGWVCRKEAARHLGYESKTLANWAVLGVGPRFKLSRGRPRYRVTDLDAWMERQPDGLAQAG